MRLSVSETSFPIKRSRCVEARPKKCSFLKVLLCERVRLPFTIISLVLYNLVKSKSISRFIIYQYYYVVVKPNTFTKSFIFRSLQKSSKWDIMLCGMYLFLQESVKYFFESANSLLMKELDNFSNQSYRVFHFKTQNAVALKQCI